MCDRRDSRTDEGFNTEHVCSKFWKPDRANHVPVYMLCRYELALVVHLIVNAYE